MMKLSSLALLVAAVVCTTACNQTPPATEQAAPATTAASDSAAAATPAAPAPATADTAAAPATATATAPAPAAASNSAPVKINFSFKPGPSSADRKTSVHLVLKGAKGQDVDLGQFSGKPDVVDKEKAKLAGFPSDMLMGFRSYDAGSGTSYDLAVMNVGGNTLRILQRKVEESADKTPEFQTSREIPLPANALVEVGAAIKK